MKMAKQMKCWRKLKIILLLTNMNEIIKKTEEFSLKYMSQVKIAGHDNKHIQRVRINAQKIAKAENIDHFLVDIAVLLHDIGRTKPGDHGDNSVELSKPFLDSIPDLTDENKIEILYAIKQHNKPFSDRSIANVLQDADKLDALGALGIMRTFMCFGDMQDYDINRPWKPPTLPIQKDEKGREYMHFSHGIKYVSDHIYKNLSWKEMFYFESAKKIAKGRFKYMEDFIKRIQGEIRGEL